MPTATGAKTSQEKRELQERKEKARETHSEQSVLKPMLVRSSSKGRKPVTNRVVFVNCPLTEEYTDEEGVVHPPLRVGFRVDNKMEYMRSALLVEGESMPERIDRIAKAIALIAVQFENWDFIHPETEEPIPVPTLSDITTYYALVRPDFGLAPLLMWIGGPGIVIAGLVLQGVNPEQVYREMPGFAESVQSMGNVFGGPGYQKALEETLSPN